jgi:RNA polymerase sigma-70 factor (ECF subfamily)
MKNSSALDGQLVKNTLEGDKDAFAALIRKYENPIYSFSYRMIGDREEAKDATQEIFIKVWCSLKSYKPEYKFSSWLYKIATNNCIDKLKKRKPSQALDHELQDTQRTDEDFEQKETQKEVQSALTELPYKYRAILILKYLQGFSIEEIGKMTNTPVNTVKVRLHRGRRMLRDVISEANGIEV